MHVPPKLGIMHFAYLATPFSQSHAMKVLAFLVFASWSVICVPARADDPGRVFLAKHCVACHGETKPKGDLRLDNLADDLADTATRERWLSAIRRVKAGEMPPKGKSRPDDKDVQALADW